ncbi:hypothetical protein ASE63_14770 [Bosea sp. Root381]|uniref:hypothetical protein n=1 Tax=Bosea sp. Root381 TaxID=1736524 RepID=UPI0007018692|nr:hypothetical protein [Bosea sp. Root381]KRE16967.1 hypothetical protein ASE63_14770 [Bosea sp. Root381]
MHAQDLLVEHPSVLSDPEWIALESLDDHTDRFVFEDSMLHILEDRGLVEAAGERWRLTEDGRQRLHERAA